MQHELERVEVVMGEAPQAGAGLQRAFRDGGTDASGDLKVKRGPVGGIEREEVR